MDSTLAKFRLKVKTDFGEVSIEGESLRDLKDSLSEMGIPQSGIERILDTVRDKLQPVPPPSISISVAPSKPELRGVVEFRSDGTPHIIVPTSDLRGREVIALLLYAKSPNAISMSELTSLMSENWKSVKMTTTSGYLSYMRAYIIKEGTRGAYTYRLSGSGKNWV